MVLERGLAESRERAKALIKAGMVFLNGEKTLKAGLPVKNCDTIEIKGETNPFVSRGGLKLKKALESFEIELNGKTCMDVGASTGGFTHCMLLNGAKKVFAIDVGFGQLDSKLCADERVVNIEKTNFRYVTKTQISEKIEFAGVDVAFISLKLIMPVLYDLLSENGEAVCLIKPQFEAGKEKIGKKGVVKNSEIHKEVINNCVIYTIENKFSVVSLDYSPIKGPEGNIEYLMHIKKEKNAKRMLKEPVDELVRRSHDDL